MKVFIICTVRDATPEYRSRLEAYVAKLESDGNNVHLPHRNTNQSGTSWEICDQNADAINAADEVHVFYNSKSQGTHFDLGVAFGLQKKIVVVESEPLTEGKSFQNLLDTWQRVY